MKEFSFKNVEILKYRKGNINLMTTNNQTVTPINVTQQNVVLRA